MKVVEASQLFFVLLRNEHATSKYFESRLIRYKGNSMVNRLIGYLGRPPFVIHRLDMDTSGVMLFAKSQHVVEPVAKLFRWGCHLLDAWIKSSQSGPSPESISRPIVFR